MALYSVHVAELMVVKTVELVYLTTVVALARLAFEVETRVIA